MKPKKITKAKLEKQRKALANKALRLWAEAVRVLARNKCCIAICDETERLNAHHIESRYSCRGLKFDVQNGICLCAGHHKFKQDSCHKSFCFTYSLLTDERIEYLKEHRYDVVEFTSEYLKSKIAELEEIIAKAKGLA